jgi:hypothetical protein
VNAQRSKKRLSAHRRKKPFQTKIFLSSMAIVGRLRKFHFGPSKAGWSLGYVSAVDSQGRTISIADAHRDDGKRYIAHADEKLTAFIELESAIRADQRLAARIG